MRVTYANEVWRKIAGLSARVPRYWLLAAATAPVLATLYLTSRFLWQDATRPTFPLHEVANLCDGVQVYDTNTIHAIPNFVHYVWLLKDPSTFRLNFKIFVSFVSAHFFFRPERIYIHTDASPAVFEEARQSADVWTRRILSIPGITPRYVTPPTATTGGVPIIHMEHQADFIRIDALRSLGGIYLDVDAVPLRDVAPLRSSGFANVLGGATAIAAKHQGYVNNGVMLAAPGSLLMQLWHTAANKFFDGAWATASIHLLTDLADRLSAVPHETLVMHPRAFAPTSWEFQDQKKLFVPILTSWPEEAADYSWNTGEVAPTCQDTIAWLGGREGRIEKGEMDFSGTYILHAFDDEISHMRSWDGIINLKYVLARQSNYARAVYPAIRQAINAGIIPESEI